MNEGEILYTRERTRFLQSQISSHFLYTTLESMRGMCAAHQEQAIRTMITRMAVLYRYCAMPSLTVPLEEEIRIVKDYEQMIRCMKANDIQMDFRIPEELLQKPVPRMLLQPLVENALLHGFLRRGIREGTISVCAGTREGRLELSVENDGEGISAETIVELNGDAGKNGSKIGFSNVKERIELMYPGNGSIEICSDGIRGAAVYIRFVPTEFGE